MAEFIIQNPSITPNVFEYDEAGRVSAISGYPLAGGGGGTIVKSDLMWKPSVESDGYVHWTLASSATTPAAAYISGAQGPAGPQGVSGNPGKTPELQINSENAHWEWRYSGDAGWTDLGVVASGAVGPQGPSGTSGANGKDGISPKVRINLETNKWEISEDGGTTWTPTNVSATGPAGEDGTDGTNGVSPTVSTSVIPGGNRVTFTYDNGGTTAAETIDVMSGVSGANGSDGYSPTVVTTDIPVSEQFPAGGTEVTITDSNGQHVFNISNGRDGAGATVNLLGGEGIEVTKVASNYTISVSADYTTKSYVDSASAYALSQAESWVEDKNYLVASDIAGKADKTDLQYVSAGVDYVSAHIPSLNGYATEQYVQGASAEVTAWVNEQGYLKSVPDTYATKTYVNEASANAYDKAVAQIPDVTNFITKDADDLTYYYKKTETSAASALSTEFAKYVTKPDTTQTVLNNNYLIYSTLTGPGTTTGWMPLSANYYSKLEADRRYVATADIGTGLYYSGSSPKLGVKLGTDLAFDANSFIKVNTNGVATGTYAFVEGESNTANGDASHAEGFTNNIINSYSHGEGRNNTEFGGNTNHLEGGYNKVNSPENGGYVHIEGEANEVTGHSIHMEGAFNIFNSTSTANRGISIEGYANATTANDSSVHGGVLKVIGNGERVNSSTINRSDAYILYHDGTVSAKQFQNADGTETINGTTYNFSGVDNIEILPNAATANTANFPNDNVLRFILES